MGQPIGMSHQVLDPIGPQKPAVGEEADRLIAGGRRPFARPDEVNPIGGHVDAVRIPIHRPERIFGSVVPVQAVPLISFANTAVVADGFFVRGFVADFRGARRDHHEDELLTEGDMFI